MPWKFPSFPRWIQRGCFSWFCDLCNWDLCNCDLWSTWPLVDQDLCNLHKICVNLHIFSRQNRNRGPKMCNCVNVIYVKVFLGMLHYRTSIILLCPCCSRQFDVVGGFVPSPDGFWFEGFWFGGFPFGGFRFGGFRLGRFRPDHRLFSFGGSFHRFATAGCLRHLVFPWWVQRQQMMQQSTNYYKN